MIRERYLQFLLQNHPEAYNENYKTYKLKDKLIKHFGDRLRFWQPTTKGELVYSAEIDEGQAIALAFELVSSDEKFLEEAALITKRHINTSKHLSSEMPWPPSKHWLLSAERKPPPILKDILSFVISGKSQQHNSCKTARLVDSLAQDICYAVTHGEWVMPKHLLLSMTVRHFELASIDEKFLEEAALITKRHINTSQHLSSEMPWPPSKHWLLSAERKPPPILKDILSFVISGKSQQHNSCKTARLVDSLAQDICYAATHGECVMPKHLLLSMTVRHLTGSAELITILNRFGHCQSYTRTLELETAMCSSI